MRAKSFLLAIAVLTSTGCAQLPAEAKPPLAATARIGDTARVGGIAITPLALIEDSRCPRDVTCIWAGRVLITARMRAGGRATEAEMELGKPVAAGGRRIVLAAVAPERVAGGAIEAGDYRFTFAAAGE